MNDDEIILRHFKRSKSHNNLTSIMRDSITLDKDMGFLIPLGSLFLENTDIISLLAKWRVEALTFPNKFAVTFEGTLTWYKNLLINVDDRILFLIISKSGQPIGHTGFANIVGNKHFEIDNVIRGVSNLEPGIMSNAVVSSMHWAKTLFGNKKFILRTLESNKRAKNFYSKIGFKECDLIPLKKIETESGYDHIVTSLRETKKPDNYFVVMHKYLE